jgi:glyoxylate/hydroxypyruvate reductase A
MSVLYKADPVRGRVWAQVLAERAPDVEFHMWPEQGAAQRVEYLVAWEPPAGWISTFPNVKVLFSSGAGVDQLDLASVPAHIQVVRMVEPGIVQGVLEYVVMSVLMLHRHMPQYWRQQANAEWRSVKAVRASSLRVGVMGLGVLGQAVLERLGAFGYQRRGWSRTRKEVDGVATFAGDKQLEEFLAGCDVLVCLLPLTQDTRGILGQRVFSALPAGASLINAGRGPHLHEAALLEALDSGRLSEAILDVTEPEPLPAAHPFWTHPRIVLTPHIAGSTQPETAALVLLENIRRHERGEPLHDAIDRSRGY